MKYGLRILGITLLVLWLAAEIFGVYKYYHRENSDDLFTMPNIYRPLVLKIAYLVIPPLDDYIEPMFKTRYCSGCDY